MARTLAMWNEALKEWNQKRGGKWTIPRKGSAEYEEVMAILNKKGGIPPIAPVEKPPTEYHPGKFSKQPEKPFKSWLVKHFEKKAY